MFYKVRSTIVFEKENELRADWLLSFDFLLSRLRSCGAFCRQKQTDLPAVKIDLPAENRFAHVLCRTCICHLFVTVELTFKNLYPAKCSATARERNCVLNATARSWPEGQILAIARTDVLNRRIKISKSYAPQMQGISRAKKKQICPRGKQICPRGK